MTEEERAYFRCYVIIACWKENEYVYVFRAALTGGDFYGDGLIWGKENLEKVLYEVLQEVCNQVLDCLYRDGKKEEYTAKFNVDVHGLSNEGTEKWTEIIEQLNLAARSGRFSKPNGKGKLIDALSRVDGLQFTTYPIEESSYVGHRLKNVWAKLNKELTRYGKNSLSEVQEVRERILDENRKYLERFDSQNL